MDAEIVVDAQVMSTSNKQYANCSNPLPCILTATPVNTTATTIQHSHYYQTAQYTTNNNCDCGANSCRKCQRAKVLHRTPGGKVGFVLLSVPLSLVGAVHPKAITKVVTNHIKRDIREVSVF